MSVNVYILCCTCVWVQLDGYVFILLCALIRGGLFSREESSTLSSCCRGSKVLPGLTWNWTSMAGALCLCTLKSGLVPSCLFSWPTSGDTRDSTPPPLLRRSRTPPLLHPPRSPTSWPHSARGLFAPRQSFKKAVLFSPHLVHSLRLGSCHQCHWSALNELIRRPAFCSTEWAGLSPTEHGRMRRGYRDEEQGSEGAQSKHSWAFTFKYATWN